MVTRIGTSSKLRIASRLWPHITSVARETMYKFRVSIRERANSVGAGVHHKFDTRPGFFSTRKHLSIIKSVVFKFLWIVFRSCACLSTSTCTWFFVNDFEATICGNSCCFLESCPIVPHRGLSPGSLAYNGKGTCRIGRWPQSLHLPWRCEWSRFLR